jgi:Flp pilus assembly protein TadG
VALVRIRKALRRSEKGQALVELALIVPVLLLLVLGVFEFGRLLNAYMTVQHAAREGARLGILGATDAEIESRVLSTAVSLDTTRMMVGIAPAKASRTTGTIMTVSVTYSFKVIVPFIDVLLGSSLPIRSSLSMRVE